MKERYQIRVAVYGLIIRDGKILMLRRKNTNWFDGFFGVPAGHLEEDETLKHAACREIKEEAELDVLESDLQFAYMEHRIHPNGYNYIDIYFKVKKWQGNPKIGEPDLSDKIGWFPIDNLPINVISYMHHGLDKIKQNIFFEEKEYKNQSIDL